MQVNTARTETHHRLAFVTGGLALGGTTAYLCNLGGELIRRNVPVLVSSFERKNPMAEDLQAEGIPVHVHDEQREIFEDQVQLILKELADFRPTAVISWLGPSSFEVLRYLPPGVVRVGAAHSDHAVTYKLFDRFAAYLDRAVGVSSHIVDNLRASPVLAKTPITQVISGVPLPHSKGVPGHRQDKPLRILYLGRLEHEQKRVRLFPRILQTLVASRIPFIWTIAGEGPERGWLEAQMLDTGSRQEVRFVGRVAYHDVPVLLGEQDIFLLTSDHEGLPLSLLESMGQGLVPVISNLPSGVREVVDDDVGRLVEPSDVDGYAQAIIWLHEHRAARQQMAATARQRIVDKFNLKVMTDQWLEATGVPHADAPAWERNPVIMPPLGTHCPVKFARSLRWARRLRKTLTARAV